MVGLLALFIAVEATIALKTTLPMTLYVLGSLVITAQQGRLDENLRRYRDLRPSMVLSNLAVLAVVAVVAVALTALAGARPLGRQEARRESKAAKPGGQSIRCF